MTPGTAVRTSIEGRILYGYVVTVIPAHLRLPETISCRWYLTPEREGHSWLEGRSRDQLEVDVGAPSLSGIGGEAGAVPDGAEPPPGVPDGQREEHDRGGDSACSDA